MTTTATPVQSNFPCLLSPSLIVDPNQESGTERPRDCANTKMTKIKRNSIDEHIKPT